MHKKEGKVEAIVLCEAGNSYAQIAAQLKISRSTAYFWTKQVALSLEAEQRIKGRIFKGQKLGQNRNREKQTQRHLLTKDKISRELVGLAILPVSAKILCAFLYWCEGGKTDREVRFANSDPELVSIFLKLFRLAFPIDEAKFRVCVHLHAYHDAEKELHFWSNLTTIPLTQFVKVYQKNNTGLRKKAEYHGCISVRYHDVEVWLEILEVYKQFSQKI